VKEFILEMKNNKATGYEEITAEFRKIFCIRRDGIETLTNMFNIFKNWERISNGLEDCCYIPNL
jgi:hypothetical protein